MACTLGVGTSLLFRSCLSWSVIPTLASGFALRSMSAIARTGSPFAYGGLRSSSKMMQNNRHNKQRNCGELDTVTSTEFEHGHFEPRSKRLRFRTRTLRSKFGASSHPCDYGDTCFSKAWIPSKHTPSHPLCEPRGRTHSD